MKLVRPVSEKKLAELEQELLLQKKRFMDAAARSAVKIQNSISVSGWIRDDPLRSATILFIGGFALARRRARRASD